MFGALYWLHKRCIVFRFYSINCQNYHSLTYLYQVNQRPKTLLVLFQSAHFYCRLWKVEFAYRSRKYVSDIWATYISILVRMEQKNFHVISAYCSLFVSRGHSYIAFCFSYYRWEKKLAFKTNRVLGTIQYGLHCKKMICSRGVVSRAWVFANQKMSGRV